MDYPKLARWKANNAAVYKKIRKIETEEQEDHIMAIGQAVEDVVKELSRTEISYDSSRSHASPT
jgi:sorbitol-specific phosphotransferase system component IIA